MLSLDARFSSCLGTYWGGLVVIGRGALSNWGMAPSVSCAGLYCLSLLSRPHFVTLALTALRAQPTAANPRAAFIFEYPRGDRVFLFGERSYRVVVTTRSQPSTAFA